MNEIALRICATLSQRTVVSRTLNVNREACKTRLLASLTLIFSLVLVSAQAMPLQRPSDDATKLVAEAKSLWKKGEEERALAIIQKAISLDPRNPAAYVQLAQIQMALQDNDKARSAVTEALGIDPKCAPAHQVRGALLRRAGDYEGAIREAQLALSLNPDAETSANSHVTLGLAYQTLKRSDEAIDEFREATHSNPTDSSNYALLGDTFFALGKYDEAEAAYRRAIDLDPKEPNTYQNLGAALQNQGRTEAIGFYQQYLTVDPNAKDRADVESRIWRLQHTPLPQILGLLLLDAAKRGYVANVKGMLAKGADVNFRDNNYSTPLSEAAGGGQIDVVKLLLAQGARDEIGVAVDNAYDNGHPEVEKLLEQAAPQPRSPKVLNRLLYTATRKGDVAKAEALLAEGADDRNGALVWAVNNSKPVMRLVELLLDKGARSYSEALISATGKGHVEIVKLMLAKGADVNVKSSEGTALIIAVQGGHAEIVKLLLDAGADVNAKGNQDFTALILGAGPSASEMNQPQNTPSPKVDTEIFQLLLAKGADVNAKNEFGETALMRANVSEKVKMLLARNSDANAKDKYGQTALLKAADLGNVDAVEALLKSGADANAKDDNGTAPLLQALHYDQANKSGRNYVETARLLLFAKNIDVNAQNRYGETALMRAVSLSSAEIVKLLLARGADVNLSDEAGSTADVEAYRRGNAEIQSLLDGVAERAQTPKVLNAFLRAAIEKKDAARVKELLAKGADPNYRFSLGYGLEGTTNIVLVLATMVGDTRIVQLLLDKGADLQAKGFIRGDESGIETGTALEAAERSNQPEIVSLLRKASATSPVVDYVSRGNGRQAKGDLDGAIADYNTAIEINTLDQAAYINRGIARMAKGDRDGAITDYSKAIEINPRDARAYNGLAWLLATSFKEGTRDGKRAVENARKASELTNWEEPNILDTLAAAYAEAGNFEEAVKWENKALSFTEFAKSTGEGARQRLQLYMQRKPYREK